MAVSVRPLNRWRATWQRHRRKGRPRPVACSTAAGGALVQGTPHLSWAGVHLFAHGLAQQQTFEPVGARLPQAIAAHQHAHPADDFARLPHRDQTLRRRFEALFFAPLWGIERLTACDTHAHPLQTLLGRGYHSTTRRQFLGQRDRIDAATALRPALVPDKARQITYVDGPMIASWSRASMHKGPSTMLGRIMAGSHAVIAHHEAGHALFVQYDPPDLQVSHVSVASCQQVALATGTALFVIDRAINAVAMAWACDAQGLGLLAMLDDNAPQGLESFAAMLGGTLEEGPKVSRGSWKVPRPDDPRHFVMVEPPESTTVVSWGPPKGQDAFAATAWPRGYRARNEIQATGFKRLLAHGALNTNDGRTTMVGPDRHQQRARAKLDQALLAAQKRLDQKTEAIKTPQNQVVESEHTGHGKRLAQRQRAWAVVEKESKKAQAQHATRAAPTAALGPPRERADRDFRTQTIMTIRTLLLENALTSFMAVLVGTLTLQVRLA